VYTCHVKEITKHEGNKGVPLFYFLTFLIEVPVVYYLS
jgi:hypothetical protein